MAITVLVSPMKLWADWIGISVWKTCASHLWFAKY